MKKPKVCQACEINEVKVIETSDNPDFPYYLCEDCNERLEARALKPIEWYRLAIIYSPHSFSLHDDFYDDNGEATQPDEEFEVEEHELAPTLEDVQEDLEALLDFAMTRWYLEDDVVDALYQHDLQAIYKSVQKRFKATPVPSIKERLLEITAEVLGPVAEKWIRKLWASGDQAILYPLARASASCLPEEEGLEKVFSELEKLEEKFLPSAALEMLLPFRSPEVVDWIENKCTTYHSHWGRLAAVSYPTWDRMKEWLRKGRPLSLVALDTMYCCGDEGEIMEILSAFPTILDTSMDEVEPVLTAYLQQDSVHKTKSRVTAILESKYEIFA
ncbi:hypothetical protein LG275_11120 [Chryseomicrobium palamuruense]